MLDIKFIREHPDVVRKDLEKRQDTEKLAWIDDVLAKDEEYRTLLGENQKLRARRNEITREINQARKAGEDTAKLLEEAKQLPSKVKESDERTNAVKSKIDHYLMRIPNILHESVPYGKDDTENELLKEVGEKPQQDFDMLPHGEWLVKNGMANFEKAGEVSGNGFYYLIGDAARLEMALVQFALDVLHKKEFVLHQPPLMLRRKPYEGVTDLGDFEDTMYKIEDEDSYLIATSEHSIAALYMDEVIESKKLPIVAAGYSPCFRKELGSHSIDTKGIFRVHHFNKVEQFVYCKPEESWEWHEKMLANAEEIWQALELPYRVVTICTGDIGIVAAKKYDIEVWMPRENTYREVVSCSNCTAYQSTRLNIKYQEGQEKDYVHTLNGTAVATSRAVRAIIENCQQKDGTVKVPKVLVPYMGKEMIGKPSQ